MGGNEVYKEISIAQLELLKDLILRARNPLITFNDDFEEMRLERDSSREYHLNMMLQWVEKNVANH